MTDRIAVEIALATPDRQALIEVEVDSGATVADVIAASRIGQQFPDLDIDCMAAGVWGKVLPRDHAVRDGDRVELYRPLEADPRTLAAGGRASASRWGRRRNGEALKVRIEVLLAPDHCDALVLEQD